jgi:hypothetical protein
LSYLGKIGGKCFFFSPLKILPRKEKKKGKTGEWERKDKKKDKKKSG